MPVNAATRAWLAAREPLAPEALQARIATTLGEIPVTARTGAPDEWAIAERCVDAAVGLLGELLERPEAGRDAALDLLTVDALVTYAFEAAASRPGELDALARRAMERTATLGLESDPDD